MISGAWKCADYMLGSDIEIEKSNPSIISSASIPMDKFSREKGSSGMEVC